jgi:hypothetical protein
MQADYRLVITNGTSGPFGLTEQIATHQSYSAVGGITGFALEVEHDLKVAGERWLIAGDVKQGPGIARASVAGEKQAGQKAENGGRGDTHW